MHWTRRAQPEWEEYFIRLWKRVDGELVSEFAPLHLSEYLKPSALWIFHDEGKIFSFSILNNLKILFLDPQNYFSSSFLILSF